MLVLSAVALVVSAVAVIVSIRSAGSARRSADAAAKSHADELGPAVMVGRERPLRERWNHSPRGLPNSFVGRPPGKAEVDTKFVRPQDLDVRILIGRHLAMKNEGVRSATVWMDAFRVDRCDDVADLEVVLSPPGERAPDALPDGKLTLVPGEQAGVIVRDGPTLGEWLEEGDAPRRIEIHAESSPDGARQNWTLEMSARLLDPVPGNDASFSVVPHQPPIARLTERPRSYPTARLRRSSPRHEQTSG